MRSPYLENYELPPFPKNYHRRKRPRKWGFIAFWPGHGQDVHFQRSPHGCVFINAGSDQVRHLYEGSIRAGVDLGKGADVTALFELDNCSPDGPNLLDHCGRIVFMPADSRRVVDTGRSEKLTYVRLLNSSPMPEARQRSAVLATLALFLNFSRADRSFLVRYFGPDILVIEPRPLKGRQRLDIVIAGPTADSKGSWATVDDHGKLEEFNPCAGAFEPWHDLLWNLFHKCDIEAVEISASLAPRPAHMRKTGGRVRSVRIFVEPEHFEEWSNELLGWFTYGPHGNWPQERKAPGHCRYLKPLDEIEADRKGGDHAR